MIPSLSLTVEITAGTGIPKASMEAIELANRLNIVVEFDFNGVRCMALPGGDYNNIVTNYHKAIKSNMTYKIATSH